MTRTLLAGSVVAALLLGFEGTSVAAQTSEEPELEQVVIGYIGLDGDPRREPFRANTEIILAPADDPTIGAQLSIDDTALMVGTVGVEMSLDVRRVAGAEHLSEQLSALVDEGSRFILVDLPDDLAADVVAASVNQEVTLLNIGASDDGLRTSCSAQLLNVIPSNRMKSDALVQFLVAHDWSRVLMLTGPTAGDKLFADSFARSAERMRLTIVDKREFSLSRDPTAREENNTLLITGKGDYDVIFVTDEGQEFARYLPYRTQLARPVIGDTGLTANAWHWTWDLNGAPQVQHRFERAANGRHMTDTDWAAWVAVKTIAQSYLRAGSVEPDAVDAYLRSDTLAADGSKGQTLNYRPWSGQLRQPILLNTADAVIAWTPLPGFEHPRNNMDTLGIDEPESTCN